MSKHATRENKTCLNCGAFVHDQYCSKCGQENRESRLSFFHLVYEFVADLLHFDGAFWSTTRYLLFSPAKLSLEYMHGKRKSFVDPIKLYIFISFIAFFIPTLLLKSESRDKPVEINVLTDDEIDSSVNREWLAPNLED